MIHRQPRSRRTWRFPLAWESRYIHFTTVGFFSMKMNNRSAAANECRDSSRKATQEFVFSASSLSTCEDGKMSAAVHDEEAAETPLPFNVPNNAFPASSPINKGFGSACYLTQLKRTPVVLSTTRCNTACSTCSSTCGCSSTSSNGSSLHWLTLSIRGADESGACDVAGGENYEHQQQHLGTSLPQRSMGRSCFFGFAREAGGEQNGSPSPPAESLEALAEAKQLLQYDACTSSPSGETHRNPAGPIFTCFCFAWFPRVSQQLRNRRVHVCAEEALSCLYSNDILSTSPKLPLPGQGSLTIQQQPVPLAGHPPLFLSRQHQTKTTNHRDFPQQSDCTRQTRATQPLYQQEHNRLDTLRERVQHQQHQNELHTLHQARLTLNPIQTAVELATDPTAELHLLSSAEALQHLSRLPLPFHDCQGASRCVDNAGEGRQTFLRRPLCGPECPTAPCSAASSPRAHLPPVGCERKDETADGLGASRVGEASLHYVERSGNLSSNNNVDMRAVQEVLMQRESRPLRLSRFEMVEAYAKCTSVALCVDCRNILGIPRCRCIGALQEPACLV